jgi:ElaB/YqjD/DUF883 family membrane-anchored ribosome-binding protein
MENKSNINDLMEEGKKQLADLAAQLEKLADTATKVAGIAAEEGSKKAEEFINQATVHVDNAKTVVEAKTKEAMATDEYKNMEAEGKKILEDVEGKINDLSKDISEKLTSIFGKK